MAGRTLFIGAALLFAAAMARAEPAEHFGTVHFPISCGAEAQRQFDRAVAMLHSFDYPETVRTFSTIAQAQPDCAMAYWGIAISERPNPLVQPLPPELLRRGAEAIAKAETAASQTPREREWVAALALYFRDWASVPQRQRSLAYEQAMARLHQRYPDDVEAGAFYALALLEAADLEDKTYGNQLKAAALLEALEPGHPDHPGILHYLIHAYDYAPLAERGLPAARRYAQLAPSAAHALHMPSHIFAQLGLWQDVIQGEGATDAFVVADARQEDPKIDIWAMPGRYHSLDFMTTAYLQLAQDRHAQAIVDERNRVGALAAEFRYTAHTGFAAIPVRHAIERHQWAEAAALTVAKTPYPQAEAVTRFGRALGAARSGNADAARTDVARLGELEAALAQSGDPYWSHQVAIEKLAASAWLALAEGRREPALGQMRQAADLEDGTEKHVAMENRLSPMRELLGEMLLEADEPQAALAAFAGSLKAAPNRYRSFAGAAAAAEALGDRATARSYWQKLLALTATADTERPEMARARAFLAAN